MTCSRPPSRAASAPSPMTRACLSRASGILAATTSTRSGCTSTWAGSTGLSATTRTAASSSGTTWLGCGRGRPSGGPRSTGTSSRIACRPSQRHGSCSACPLSRVHLAGELHERRQERPPAGGIVLPRTIQHPARLVPLAFLIVILVGTSLLMLPISRAGPGGAPLLTALFTATSAVCVTGMNLHDTSTYWSGFGQVIILILFQVGGLGIMTGATLLGLLVTRRLRLSNRLVAQAETRSIALGDVAGVMRLILIVTVSVEAVIAAILTLRLRYAYQEPWETATWNGLFHAISGFTNAGFSTYPDSVMRFVADPWIILPITVAVVLGGLGFPVLYEVRRKPGQPMRWSVHTKITLLGTTVLLIGGSVAVLAFEWSSPETLGPLNWTGKLLAAAFHSAMTRSGGFNSVDIGK